MDAKTTMTPVVEQAKAENKWKPVPRLGLEFQASNLMFLMDSANSVEYSVRQIQDRRARAPRDLN